MAEVVPDERIVTTCEDSAAMDGPADVSVRRRA
jgi:hypothetical protein